MNDLTEQQLAYLVMQWAMMAMEVKDTAKDKGLTMPIGRAKKAMTLK